MGLNKVIDRIGNTLLDLSNDTVTSDKVLAGERFHGPDGEIYFGSLPKNEIDDNKYTFYDYDGTLLYSFSDEEIDAMIELPAGPDHTDENLTFQEWNWSLEDLKTWNRSRPDRPMVGANYITTDGKSYIYIDTPLSNAKISFTSSGLNSVDWGDGTIDKTSSHTYSNPGKYIIVIDIAENGYFYFGSGSPSKSTNKQYITSIKFGHSTKLEYYGFYNLNNLETITMPKKITTFVQNCLTGCRKLKAIVIPRGATTLTNNMLNYCNKLKIISIPNTLTTIEAQTCQNTFSLEKIVLPDSITSMGGSAFSACSSLKRIVLPQNITTIPGNCFYNCYSLETIILNKSLLNIETSAFQACYSIKNINIPEGLHTIGSTAFKNCYSLSFIDIPGTITSIGSNAFSNSDVPLVIDLSEVSSVIQLTSSIGLSTDYGSKILIPSSFLNQYKSASYWSSYASIMEAV